MTNIAQRISELRTEKNLSRPALAEALKLPKTAIEKFETGRQSPSKEQVQEMADFFGVSVFYLRGESNDRTRQDSWLEGNYSHDEPEFVPVQPKAPKAKPADLGQNGTIFDSLLKSRAFRDMVRETVLEVLRSPEGQELMKRAMKPMK